jgi:hypothetical protein
MTSALLQARQGAADLSHLGFITESALEGYRIAHTTDMNIVSKADGKSHVHTPHESSLERVS